MMVPVDYIIVGWSIRGINKIKLMVTSLYEIPNGNIMKLDMGTRLMGCFCFTPNGGLGRFCQFIPNDVFLLRQPIPPLLGHY